MASAPASASSPTTGEFILRPASESDLEEWGRVAGMAFAFKGGDPDRFLKNHLADVEAAAADIHVSAYACSIGKLIVMLLFA